VRASSALVRFHSSARLVAARPRRATVHMKNWGNLRGRVPFVQRVPVSLWHRSKPPRE
jgi:hypothetical protein